MGDVADAVRIHYTALPKGMFGEVQLPRHKSVDAIRLPQIKEVLKPRKVKTVKRKANKKSELPSDDSDGESSSSPELVARKKVVTTVVKRAYNKKVPPQKKQPKRPKSVAT